MSHAPRTNWSLALGAVGLSAIGLAACEAKQQLASNEVIPVYVQSAGKSAVASSGGALGAGGTPSTGGAGQTGCDWLVYAQQDCTVSVSLEEGATSRSIPSGPLPETQAVLLGERLLGCGDEHVLDAELGVEVSPCSGCQGLSALDSKDAGDKSYVFAHGAESSVVLSAGEHDPDLECARDRADGLGEYLTWQVCETGTGMMFDQAWIQSLKDRLVVLVPGSGELLVYLLAERAAGCGQRVALDLTNSEGVFGWSEAEHAPGVVYLRGERSTELFRAEISVEESKLKVLVEKEPREVVASDFVLDLIDDPGRQNPIERLFVVERGTQADLEQLNQQREQQELPPVENVSEVSTLTMGFQPVGAFRAPLALRSGTFIELELREAIGHRLVAVIEGVHDDVLAHRIAIVDLRSVLENPTEAIIQYESETGFHAARKVSENSLALLRETAPRLFDVSLLHHPTATFIHLEHTPDESAGFVEPVVSHAGLRLLVRTPEASHTPWRLVRVDELGGRVAEFELPARARGVFERWCEPPSDGCTPGNLRRVVVDHPTAGGMISIFDVDPQEPPLEGQPLRGRGRVVRGFLNSRTCPL